ncbi:MULTISPECIES: SdrD B-like domain-containing protein [Anaerolinea]|uniref:SdrD B-like domain and LysM peptidoglycan-binding domain-containing protein n=1 Tax=Anaerolinea TaxID=233189 RepID=UPI0026103B6C|nr:LysM peptidoglycan-binding domain-containing protein [Anaerolinea thermophila]
MDRNFRFATGFVFILLIGLMLASLALPVAAQPPEQVTYQTPTPQPDGRILYIVQPGDNCLRIELLTGVKVQTLRELNNLDSACTLVQGQELLLGVATVEPTPTPAPDITPTPLLPTPTPMRGTGQVCIILFADLNGDAVREDNEPPILGGAVSVTDRTGNVSLSGLTTDNPDNPLCFADVPEGEYNVSLAVPMGYNPTTTTSVPIKLLAGNVSVIDFGAQISVRQPPPGETQSGGRSPLLLVLGALLVLGGIGLAVYVRVFRNVGGE